MDAFNLRKKGNELTYNLKIVLTIKHPLEHKNVLMELNKLIQFVPVEGMTLCFSNLAEDDTAEFEMGAPYYDFSESSFMEDQTNNSIVEFFSEGGKEVGAKVEEVVKWYEGFGFKRIESRVITAK